jgi:hypothetical protein
MTKIAGSGSGSTPKCHGSATLELQDNYSTMVRFDQLLGEVLALSTAYRFRLFSVSFLMLFFPEKTEELGFKFRKSEQI